MNSQFREMLADRHRATPGKERRRTIAPGYIFPLNSELGAGIYGLVSGQDIVYVGKSVSISNRVRDHVMESKKDFDGYAVLDLVPSHATDFLSVLEEIRIHQFHPPLNRTTCKFCAWGWCAYRTPNGRRCNTRAMEDGMCSVHTSASMNPGPVDSFYLKMYGLTEAEHQAWVREKDDGEKIREMIWNVRHAIAEAA